MKKRLLSLLLVLVMVLGMLPVAAFAADAPISVTADGEECALSVHGNYQCSATNFTNEIPVYKVSASEGAAIVINKLADDGDDANGINADMRAVYKYDGTGSRGTYPISVDSSYAVGDDAKEKFGLTTTNTVYYIEIGALKARTPLYGLLVEVIPVTYTVTLPSGEGYTAAASGESASPVTAGGSYSFTVKVADGYDGTNMVVKANDTELTADNGVYTIANIQADQNITVTGVEAAFSWENPYTDVTAYWSNFRNSLYNMAITDTKTPASAATTAEKWVVSYASGWNTPSGMIIADDSLIFMCANTLKKIDLQTGKVIAEGTMSAGSGFAIISPTYADGLIFCPQTGGKIEAFDVKTLESVWTFADALGGQNNTAITYADGYLYTGFWNGESKEANYVCVNAATGKLVWSKTVTGGFYWAGSTVVGDAVIVGTDDGASGYTGDSHLYAWNRLNGELISDITLTGMGDMRSSVAYSEEKGRVYFTTKNGYIASAAVDAESGALSDLKSSKVAAQATSTPVVYGDKVFVSVGSGMQEGSTAGTYVVADADTMEGLYEIPMSGYGQGSTLISTAYLEETGKLYCYATYNNKPGGLILIKIDPNKNDISGAEVEEIYAAPGYEQYCLISPICGADGTIYYRNDSGYIFALTNNEAYLTGLSADAGTFSEEFAADDLSYELVVPTGTQTVTLTPTACEGGTAEAVTVTLVDGTATAEILVTKGSSSRTYTVSIREISSNAALSELKVNESNSYTGTALELTPEFAANTYYYGVYNVGSVRSFDNVWPTAADANASVAVYALSNVKEGTFDTETGEIAVTATNQNHDRYAVYFADDTKAMAVRIVVTAENGDTASYVLVLSKEAAAEDGAALLDKIKAEDKLAADQAAAAPVIALIDAIGEVTLDSADAIEAARAAYDALTDEQKTLVSNYDVLVAAEARFEQLKDEATANPVDIYVTISNKGSVVVAQQKITVTDENNNGFFDVDDALYAAHEKFYTGGAAAGYGSYESQWGLSLSMLWGDTSYCYGYWLNNNSCWSLEDVVAEGDHLVAFVYADGTGWSDAYTKFDKFDYAVEAETALTVKLDKAGYDDNYNTVFSAHAGATVTVYDGNMKAVAAKITDNGDGTYTVTVDAAGTYYLVATDSDPLTVPAVSCLVVTAKAEPETPTNPSTPGSSTGNPQTGDDTNIAFFVIIMLGSVACLAALLLTSKKKYADR